VGRGVQQEYQDMSRSFTCCVGTGMESHALHGYGVYYESRDVVWVNLFVPSSAQCDVAGVRLETETGFPDGDRATIRLTVPRTREVTLAVRRPWWAGDGFAISVNGENLPQPVPASLRDAAAGGRGSAIGNEAERPTSTFVDLKRTWKTGDTIELVLPKSVRLEPTPDNARVAAIMWGPLVLAGDHGPRREGRGGGGGGGGGAGGGGGGRGTTMPADSPIPALVAADRPPSEWVVPAAARLGDFMARRVARVVGGPEAQAASPADVPLAPFYRTHRRRYSVYFDVITPAEYDERCRAFTAEEERRRRLEAATVSVIRPGDEERERDFNYRSDPADRAVQRTGSRTSRGGAGWFSYDVPVEPTSEMGLVVTYFNAAGVAPVTGDFEIAVEGQTIARFEPNRAATGYWDARYAIPATLVGGKARVTVRFQAAASGRIVPVFSVRVVRAAEL
jgi:hypothetical protein